MNPRILSVSSDLIVPLDDLKTHLNYQHSTVKDGYITSLAKVAQERACAIMGRTMLDTTYELTLGNIEAEIYLPKPPLISVLLFTYSDSSNQLTTGVENTDYMVYNHTQPGVIKMITFPSTYDRDDAVKIQYRAGFENINDIPASVKHFIRLKVHDWFGMRGTQLVGTIYTTTKEDEQILFSERDFHV